MKTWKTESFEMLFGPPAEAERAKKEAWPILIPVGTMEYHSHHCPYGCDSLAAIGLADRLANETNCVVMPPSITAWPAMPWAVRIKAPSTWTVTPLNSMSTACSNLCFVPASTKIFSSSSPIKPRISTPWSWPVARPHES